MKNYFSFHLTGKKFLPLWIGFLVFAIVPYALLYLNIKEIKIIEGSTGAIFIFLLVLLMIIAIIVFGFYMIELLIENIGYKDKIVDFTGTYKEFVRVILLGLLLSIITLGIYIPWFIRNIHRFIINNSSLNSSDFSFQGKGGRLFVIFLLALIIPIFIITILMFKQFHQDGEYGIESPNSFLNRLIMILIMIPFYYLINKWRVNINYKNYNISWETNFWDACGKIFLEVLLTAITFGLYYPLALLRLYKYFIERTVALSAENKKRFGFDADYLNDFLFLWGQILLTIITLGIYYPWALSKVGSRILGKTYLE